MSAYVRRPEPHDHHCCLAEVQLCSRERRAEAEGRDPRTCGAPTYRIVDGEPLCRAHAGVRALTILEYMP